MKVDELIEGEDVSLKTFAKKLELRSTPSHIPMDMAEKAYTWLQQMGYRYHVYEHEGKKYFKMVNQSFKNVDYRSKHAIQERVSAENTIETFGFKVGRTSRHVKDNKSFREYGWMQVGSPRYIYFW